MSATTPLNNVVVETAKKGIKNMLPKLKSYPRISDDIMFDILDNLSSDRYNYFEDWFRVGCALKNGGYSFELFDHFSSKCTRTNDKGNPVYTQYGARKTWDSIKSNIDDGKKPFTVGGLLGYLKEDVGEERYKQILKPKRAREKINYKDKYSWSQFIDEVRYETDFSEVIYLQKLQRVCAYIEGGADSEVILKFCNVNKPIATQKYTAFIKSCKTHKYDQKMVDQNGNIMTVKKSLSNFIEKYLDDIKYKEKVFLPYAADEDPPEEDDQFNLYSGLSVEYDDETELDELYSRCEIIFNHIYTVLCNEDEASYYYVVKWLAHMFQYPRELPQTCLIFTGSQGCGKGVVWDALRKHVFGKYFEYCNSLGQITGKFNGRLDQKLMANGDEAKATKKKWDVDFSVLKSIVTNSILPIEEKGKESRVIYNFIRLILTSNNMLPVKLEKGDRRYFISQCNNKYAKKTPENTEYWKEWVEKVVDSNVAITAFYNVLMRFDISNFNPAQDLVMTDDKEYFIDCQKDSLELFIENFDWVFNEYSVTEKRVVSVSKRVTGCPSNELFKAYTKWCEENNYKPLTTITSFGIKIRPFINWKKRKDAKYYFPK